MTYELEFDPRALKEWEKLDASIRVQFKKKIAKVLLNPHIQTNKLRELPACYKIKLRTLGYRLVYQVHDERIVVLVIAIGKRENSEVYNDAEKRV